MSNEIKDLLIADATLTVAFSILYTGGLQGLLQSALTFVVFLPIAFVAVSLSFILHEYMHKIVAQRYGAVAAFKKWDIGIAITLLTSLFGFLIGLPGATMIYASRFTKEEEGRVSLAGPLVNFAVFIIFTLIGLAVGVGLMSNAFDLSGTYIQDMIVVTKFISVWLAFFNMLPMYPLDGSKVLRWNKGVYAATVILIFGFLYLSAGAAILPSVIFAMIISIVFSFMYSGLFRIY